MGLLDKIAEEAARLVKAGYPESVAKRIATGELPMDNASRMARAEAQGYDMTPQYHGSQSDILEFRPSVDGKMGAGVYTSDNPEVANRYAAGKMGDNVTPVLLRGESINRKDAIAANPDIKREEGETNRDMFDRLAQMMQEDGYDRMDIGGPQQGQMIRESVTYNPDNIRSQLSAAFDPEYSGSNILGMAEQPAEQTSGQFLSSYLRDTAGTSAANAIQSSLLEAAMSDRAPSTGMVMPEDDGLRGRAQEAIAGGLDAVLGESDAATRNRRYQTAGDILSVADFLPFVGGATGAADTVDSYQQGDWLGTALGALGAVAGALPAVGGLSKRAEGILSGITEKVGEFDSRYIPGKRKPGRTSDLKIEYENTGDAAERPTVSLMDYEGYPFITTMADRTAAGRLLTGINDTALERPVELIGGQDYMFDSPYLWASATPVIKGMANFADTLRSATGKDPLYMPWRMAPTGGDFTPMTGKTMLAYASAAMPAKTKKQLDKAIKEIDGDWVGVDNPLSFERFESLSDAKRKKIKNMMDVKFRNEGGLGIDEARLAVSQPEQRAAKGGLLQNVGQFSGETKVVPSGRSEYPSSITGEGLGVLDRDVGAYQLLEAKAAQRGMADPANPSPQDLRAIQMSGNFGGIITDDMLRKLGY